MTLSHLKKLRGSFVVSSLAAVLAVTLALPANAARREDSGSAAKPASKSVLPAGFREFRDGRVPVMIELTDTPAVQVWASERRGGMSTMATTALARVRTQLYRIEDAQAATEATMSARGIDATVLFRMRRTFNGIAAEISRDDFEKIRALPGVKAIHPLPSYKLSLSTSVPLIGAPQVWSNGNLSVRGDGIRIGIIDTGIDYAHRDFGGDGNYNQNFTDSVVPYNQKVVGGYDFAGDAYDSDSSDPLKRQPKPDPDPMDCNGHGTHVSGIAAGYGMNKDGSTYTGNYDSSIDYTKLLLGPGVAPRAKLYALRVFGCDGSTSLAADAIEWAVDPNQDGDFSDHLDIINMSLGSSFGASFDISAMASNNAALAGVTVVAAAGNAGETYYIAGAPASADRAISVASSIDGGEYLDTLVVNAPASIAGKIGSHYSTTFDYSKLTSPATANLYYPADQASGCDAFSAGNAAAMKGKFALLDWTDNACNSTARVTNAFKAGATGAIIVYNKPVLNIGILGSSNIPSAIVEQVTGEALKANADSASVSFDATLRGAFLSVSSGTRDQVSSFSSLGPRTDDNFLKPDLAAPGDEILSAKVRSGSGTVVLSGTSMATPHVAGAMALLKQLHPGWTPEELKALAMNSSTHDLFSNLNQAPPKYGLTRVGAGRVDLQNGVAANVIAYADDQSGRVSVFFGTLEVVNTLTVDRKVKIANKGTSAVTATLSLDTLSPLPGVTFSLPDGASVSLAPGESKSIRVRLSAAAADMRNVRDAALAAADGTIPRHFLNEAGSYLLVTPSAGPAVRLPLYAIARPASAMKAATSQVLLTGRNGHVNLGLTGTPLNSTPSAPDAVLSKVMPFELAFESPNETATDGIFDGADLRYLGVTSDYPAKKSVASSTLQFALTTWGDWTTLNLEDFYIFIDSNSDGTDDFIVTNLGGSDTFETLVCPATATSVNQCSTTHGLMNGFDASQTSIPIYNTNVVTFTVPATAIGLSDATSSFRWHVTSDFIDLGGEGSFLDIDSSPVFSYDVAKPGLSFGGDATAPVVFSDLTSTNIAFDYDLDRLRAAKTQGLLLLHYSNAAGNRTEVISLVPPRLRPARR